MGTIFVQHILEPGWKLELCKTGCQGILVILFFKFDIFIVYQFFHQVPKSHIFFIVSKILKNHPIFPVLAAKFETDSNFKEIP